MRPCQAGSEDPQRLDGCRRTRCLRIVARSTAVLPPQRTYSRLLGSGHFQPRGLSNWITQVIILHYARDKVCRKEDCSRVAFFRESLASATIASMSGCDRLRKLSSESLHGVARLNHAQCTRSESRLLSGALPSKSVINIQAAASQRNQSRAGIKICPSAPLHWGSSFSRQKRNRLKVSSRETSDLVIFVGIWPGWREACPSSGTINRQIGRGACDEFHQRPLWRPSGGRRQCLQQWQRQAPGLLEQRPEARDRLE